MNSLWQALLANLALLSILVVLWDFVGEWTSRLSKTVQAILFGAICGGGAIISMSTATIVSGFVLDLRAPFIAAAAFFGGVPGVLVAGSAAFASRFSLGGVGMEAGLADIAITCAIGLGGYRWMRGRGRFILYETLFSAAVAFGRLLAYALVPAPLRWTMLAETGPAVVTTTFSAALLMSLVLGWQARRRELSAQNALYRAMVRELPDCLNVKDTEGRFIAANPATATYMGAKTVADLIGKTDFDFFPEDFARTFRADEEDMLRTAAVHRVDQSALFADGQSGWLSTLKVPLHDERGDVVGIITHNRDITDIRRVAEAKSEFIATVSHELRTPLTSIRGSLGLIAAGAAGPLTAKAAGLVKIAHANSERLVLLTNNILDIERLGADRMPFELQPMMLGPIIELSIAASESYLPERSITFKFMNEAFDAVANVDPDRLQQLMANLLSNAIKFSPEGRMVNIRLAREPLGKLTVSVSDCGTGIPDTFRQRIFGRFEQADASDKREKGGTGLGLSISKAIVERLGGSIDFRSKLGAGTTFFFSLPECQPPKSNLTHQRGIKKSPITQ